MRRLHLIVADLPAPDLLGGPAAFRRQAPALSALLARGRAAPGAPSLGAALAGAFGLDEGLPIAPYSLAMDGLAPGDDCWMRADPVSLRFYRDHLVLLGPAQLGVSREEADALTATLNDHFKDDGLHFLAPATERWYVRLNAAPDLATQPLDAVAGRPIEAHLPRGAEAGLWRARMNEVQMLLHDHPVNLAREARGAPPVNSVWFWGAGRYAPLPRPPFSCLGTQHPMVQALAGAAGVNHCPVDDLDELPRTEHALAVLEFPQSGDAEAIAETLSRLESTWFRPVLRRLRSGALKHLQLETTGALALSRGVTPLGVWRLWRRAAPSA